MSYVILLLLFTLFIKEFLYLRKVKIKTIKTATEIVAIVCTITFIIICTIIFAKQMLHYIASILGISLIMVMWFKQGICDEGILIENKGKQLFKWNEIIRSTIVLYNESFEITYYKKSGVKIVKHEFDKKYLYRILEILKDNNVRFGYKE